MKKFVEKLKRIKWSNVLCAVLILILLVVGGYELYSRKIHKNYYEMKCTVEAITENVDGTHNVLFKDNIGGNGWFFTTSENYSVNDNYILTYDSMNTISIYDDEIVRIERPLN